MKNLLFLSLICLIALFSVNSLKDTSGDWIKSPEVWKYDEVAKLDWKLIEPENDEVIPLLFAVQQKNLDKLEKIVLEVSDPKSPKYGQHYSRDELKKIFSIPESLKKVEEYIRKFPVEYLKVGENGQFIEVRMKVKHANRLLNTNFFRFSLKSNPTYIVYRCPYYHIPSHLQNDITLVAHTLSFPQLKFKPVIMASKDGINSGIVTPQLVNQHYHISSNDATGQTDSVYESLGQSFLDSDTHLFDNHFGVPIQTVSRVVGPNDGNSCYTKMNNCVEAELDVQQLSAVARDANMTYWAVQSDESFLQWANEVSNDNNPPSVFSISYGGPETSVSSSQARLFDQVAAKLAARGVSIVVASGDDGVGGNLVRGNPSACGFTPSWPATAPHLTAVGATQGPEDGKTEVACAANTGGGITTGGGFSDIFSTPSWQQSQVSGYLNSARLPPRSQFNTGGRGYPDVSLVGHNFPVAIGGQLVSGVSGTSASTPLFAGMITLINKYRAATGKSTLGFLNPLIYSMSSSAFYDITQGENNCSADTQNGPTCCQYGFFCSAGWDPLTGRGSINFPNFLKYAMSN